MNDWIEWVWSAEKPYPETLDTIVDVRFRDGEESSDSSVYYWYDEDHEKSNWWQGIDTDAEIVAYRVVS